MEDFLGLIVVIAIALLSASGKNKKKQGKHAKAGAGRSRQHSPAAGKRAERHAAQSAEASAAVFAQQSCEGEPIHLHEATQEQMYSAQEGEDPCHAGGRAAASARELDEVLNALDAQIGQETASAAAQQQEMDMTGKEDEDASLTQDILRGVIMSEILTRPCERRNRRRAY